MEESDKQYNGRLIDEYMMLKDIKAVAKKENAVETLTLIEEKINVIKLKLKPLYLPDELD